jgi:hypothetical protein
MLHLVLGGPGFPGKIGTVSDMQEIELLRAHET